MKKKLYRSNKDKIVGGVCGGVAEYFSVDPTLVRISWVVLALLTSGIGGIFILLYIAALIIVPVDREVQEGQVFVEEDREDRNKKLTLLIGGGLIAYGAYKLFQKVVFALNIPIISKLFSINLFWPVMLIAGGAFIIFYMGRRKDDE